MQIDFTLEPTELSSRGITPTIDGRRLVDLVAEYEQARGFDPAGGYGGLVPGTVGDPDLTAYYLGLGDAAFPEPGSAWLLGCECGESGCWPLEAKVTATSQTVTWSDFSQPHRPDRIYDGFGPFVFDRSSYEEAVRRLGS